jgi:hypothetical protein
VNSTKKAAISIQANESDTLPEWVQVGLRDKIIPKFLAVVSNVIFEIVDGVIKIIFEATAQSMMIIYGKIKDTMPTSILRRNACTIGPV